ncbi:hypothetical protein T484DRAFT_3483470 [Baffinella frigidus]|nr:hypothetical protein T484DRAFT_3483470 [Cryptophyta sp. CCMP2293]
MKNEPASVFPVGVQHCEREGEACQITRTPYERGTPVLIPLWPPCTPPHGKRGEAYNAHVQLYEDLVQDEPASGRWSHCISGSIVPRRARPGPGPHRLPCVPSFPTVANQRW